MNFVWISSSGVPTMPRVFKSSRQGGTPQAMKKASDDSSIQREKLGKKTIPAGSQSPKCTCTRWMWVLLMGSYCHHRGHREHKRKRIHSVFSVSSVVQLLR